MVSMAAAELLTREDLDAMPDDGNRYELIEGEIVGAPSSRSRHQYAAVEVLSPATRRRDLGQKKRIYEQSGVAAYWVVDVESDEIALTAWELRDGAYVAVAAIAGDEEWTATAPFEVTVVPSRLIR